jgi:hypothetical protein
VSDKPWFCLHSQSSLSNSRAHLKTSSNEQVPREMLVHDVWQGLDRLSFYENAILLDVKHPQQGASFKTCPTRTRDDLIEGTGLPHQLVRHFLDDIALVGAGSGGKDNVSAAFIGFGTDEKSLITFIARNEGLDEARLQSLQRFVRMILVKAPRGL